MGFDNECVLNIQSLPGEYFCPVCRQLIYPNEAMQTHCTHLYCKPCLTYVLGTTRACPYDNYLVTEETSKALLESNPTLAETIGRVMVHCLYHKSGCTWQGGLTEGITHGQSCAYGSSPVVCNRCGTQIVHRQVQEHAMTCTGTQAQTQVQPQQQDATQQAQAAAAQQPQTAAAAATTATTAALSQVQAHAQTQAQPGAQPAQAATAQNTTQASATDQWYQQYQQYQQYYQQYPQYYQPQFEQQQQQMQAQTQSQAQVQPQTQVQPQAQVQSQAQMQPHAQVQPQQHAQPQAQVHSQAHPQPQVPAAQMQHPQAPSHLQPQPHQQMGHPHQAHQQHMMPAQAQQVPIQQQMPIAQPHQQPAPGAHQAGHPTQLNQQIPGGAQQQQQHVQHHPHHAQMFPQQLPNQQHQAHIPQQQAAVHQPTHPQQQAMLQQVPPQLQQPNSAPVHQAAPFPQQHQALSQHPTHQPHPQQQAQAPFHPQPIQNQQQLIPPHNNAALQQQAQMQPPYHQGPPQQSFPQQYPHQAQINAVQQSGNRPPSQNFMQPPLQQPQLRPSPSTYGSRPTKAFPTEAPNHGLVPNQQFMQRPGYRPPPPHQQRPPARQAGLGRPAHQQPPSTSVISQASRMMPQVTGHGTVSSTSPRPMPAIGKGPEIFGQAPTPKDSEQLGNDQQKVKDPRMQDANAVSGQSKVAAVGSVKGESSKIEGEENATQEPKKDSSFEPSFTENSKRMEQFSSKASESKNQDEESQQLISHNKELEDATQKPLEEDKEANSSIEPKKENNRLEGSLQSKPHQAPESNPSQNVFNQFKESGQRGEEKVGRSTVDGLRRDNVSQHLQRPDHSSQQNIHHGPLAQSHERNMYNPRQGMPPMQDRNTNNLQGKGRDFDSRSPHPIPIQERPAMPPSRPAPSHVQNTWQQPQHHVPVATSNIDRSAQQASHQGVFHGHDNNLPQYMPSGRNAQQLPMQGQEKFYPPSNQGQFLGQKGAYPSQTEMNDKGFQQQPFLGQMHNAEQLHSGTSKVGNPMSIMPHLASSSSTLASSVGRGPSHTHPPPTNFDLLSQNPQNVNLAPRSSQTDSMLGLSSGLSMSMPYPQNPFDVPRNVTEKGSHFPQSMPQSYSSKQMDHVDIMGGRKPDFMDKHKNEQQMMSSRFGMVQNEGTIKSPFEALMGSSYPPVNGEDGVLRGMHHDSGRHLPERKDFFEEPRKYRATHFDEPLKSNSTDLFATSRYPKGTPTQFDKFVPTSRPAEVGTHGFARDAASKFPLSSTGSPGVGHSNPYTSRSFSPSKGSSMFSNIGDGPRLLGVQEEMKGRRPEPSALRSDFMGPRSDFGRSRLDTFGSRSPGKDYGGFSSARGNLGPASNLVGNGGPHIPRAGDEIGRDPIGFEDQRNKSYDFHSTSTYDAFPPPGNRHQPFRSSGFSAGGPGTMPNRMIMGEPGISSLGPNLSKHGFSGEGMLPKGPIMNDLEPIELGRKRNPSTSGWCRICNVDCYTVEGLEQHSQTKEHQKKAMDMVMSIKKDSAKRQKIAAEDPAPQENGKKAKRSSFEGRGSRR